RTSSCTRPSPWRGTTAGATSSTCSHGCSPYSRSLSRSSASSGWRSRRACFCRASGRTGSLSCATSGYNDVTQLKRLLLYQTRFRSTRDFDQLEISINSVVHGWACCDGRRWQRRWQRRMTDNGRGGGGICV
ncbi:unnamed protein product, partial [Ectocarpus sp. 8 AP-2014]